MDRPRICHVIHNTEHGGAETMLYKLVRELSARCTMQVVSLLRVGQVGQRIRDQGVPVVALNCFENRIPRVGRLARLIRILRDFRPDVVQTWTYHADLCGGLAARLLPGTRIVWNVRHGTLSPGIDSRNVLRSAKLCGRLSTWVPNKILMNSRAAMEVHAAAGYQRDKMKWIPNGFDTDEYKPCLEAGQVLRRQCGIPLEAPVIGSSGRFHPHKAHDCFVSVAEEVLREWPEAHFILAGSGCDDRNTTLQAWIRHHNVAHRFHLLGARSDMPDVLNALDVFLLTSITEGMPNAIGEAMACELEVVATDVGDCAALIGGMGTIVEPGDVQGLAKGVSKALRDRGNSVQARKRRQRIVDQFSIKEIAAQYEELWMNVGARTKPAVLPRRPVLRLTNKSLSSDSQSVAPKLMHVATIPFTLWTFLRGQNQYMQDCGFDVHGVSSPGEYLSLLRERDHVTTHGVPMTRQITPLSDAISAWKLMRCFRVHRPDIVQLSTPKAALLGAIAAKAAKVPIRIYQVRGLSSESETGKKRALYQRLERLTAELCNAHLVNSHSLLRYAKRARILRGGVVMGSGMSNGVDVTRFEPSTRAADLTKWGDVTNDKKGRVIGFIGRLTKDKGIEDIYSAWLKLREEFKDARLLLVGPMETENGISRECRQGLENDARVILTGEQRDVAPFYKCMDVFVYPSHGTEGFPNAPMEAAAMSLPVVASAVVGNVDAVVHNVTGTLIPARQIEALSQGVRRYMSDSQLRISHGINARSRVLTEFAPVRLWEEFQSYYTHLLRREGLSVPTATEGDLAARRAA